MKLEKIIEAAVKEKDNPCEKLFNEKSGFKPEAIKAAENLTPDIAKATVLNETEVARKYFASIGDTEKLKALEGTDEVKKAEALMEAGEKCPELSQLMKESHENLIKKNDGNVSFSGSLDVKTAEKNYEKAKSATKAQINMTWHDTLTNGPAKSAASFIPDRIKAEQKAKEALDKAKAEAKKK